MPTPRLSAVEVGRFDTAGINNAIFTAFDRDENHVYWYQSTGTILYRANVPNMSSVTNMGMFSITGFSGAVTFDPNSSTLLIIVRSTGIFRLDPSTQIETLLMDSTTFNTITNNLPPVASVGYIIQAPNNKLWLGSNSGISNALWEFDPIGLTLTKLGKFGLNIPVITLGSLSATSMNFVGDYSPSIVIFSWDMLTDELQVVAGTGHIGTTDGNAFTATFGDVGQGTGFNNLFRAGPDLLYAVMPTGIVRWIQNDVVGSYNSPFSLHRYLPGHNLGFHIEVQGAVLYA